MVFVYATPTARLVCVTSEAEAQVDYNAGDYPPFAVTVDVAIFTIVNDALQVLLVERGEPPFLGSWALPGGFVRPDENLDQAANRELLEETGVDAGSVHLEQLGTYGSPDRDPRMRVVTVAYWAILGDLSELHPAAGSDARDAGLVPVSKIEAGGLRLAFDHATIIHEAIERTRSKLEYTTLATAFCPPEFTISQLRRVYEAVWNTQLDPGNFHRKVKNTVDFVQPVGAYSDPGVDGGRPAELYEPGPALMIGSPLDRSPSPPSRYRGSEDDEPAEPSNA